MLSRFAYFVNHSSMEPVGIGVGVIVGVGVGFFVGVGIGVSVMMTISKVGEGIISVGETATPSTLVFLFFISETITKLVKNTISKTGINGFMKEIIQQKKGLPELR